MKQISYYNRDKSQWSDGPWRTEPDKIQWRDEATGYACLITRAEHGALCGYVGVSPGHKLHGKYPGDTDDRIDCHGGWNFSTACQSAPEGHGVCHIVESGEPDDMWWLGFDCAHARDYAPGYDSLHKSLFGKLGIEGENLFMGLFDGPRKIYRELPYVRAVVAEMAQQIKSLEALE